MSFYIRKSVKVGPFRMNLSKSGLGLSVGVKGLRVGVGPAGRYIHMGRGGLYYRKTFSETTQNARQRSPTHEVDPLEFARIQQDWSLGPMSEFRSVDALTLTESNSKDLIDELNAKRKLIGFTPFAGTLTVIAYLLLLSTGTPLWLLALLAVPVGTGLYWLRQRDEVRKTTVLFYSLEGDTETAYQQLCTDFEAMTRCKQVWRVDAQASVRDRKYHAGANLSIRRTTISASFKEAPGVRSNVTIPALPLSDNTLYFFPDRILVLGRTGWGAIDWDSLRANYSSTRFIEDQSVPSDAAVVDHTWRYVNRDGGPDRRFNNNHKIPVCLYGEMTLSTASGLTEMLHTSRAPCANALVESLLFIAIAHEADASLCDTAMESSDRDSIHEQSMQIFDSPVDIPRQDDQNRPNRKFSWIVASSVLTTILLLVIGIQRYNSAPDQVPLAIKDVEIQAPVAAGTNAQQLFNDGFDKMIAGENLDDAAQVDAGRQIIENIVVMPRPSAVNAKLAREKNEEGTRLIRSGAFDAAAATYAEGCSLDPTDSEIADNKGYAFYKAGKFADAKEAELQTIRLAPTRFTAWGTLASTFAALGQGDIATSAFGLSIRFAKRHDKALVILRKLATEDSNQNVRLAAENAYLHRASSVIAPPLQSALPKIVQSGIPPLFPATLITVGDNGKPTPVYTLNNSQFSAKSSSDGYEIPLGSVQDCSDPECLIGTIYAHFGNIARDGNYEAVQLFGGVEGRHFVVGTGGQSLVIFEMRGVTYGFTFKFANGKDISQQVAESALRLSSTDLIAGISIIQASHQAAGRAPSQASQLESVSAAGAMSTATTQVSPSDK
jgi:tetratricopeptide (TPR) repeat protein